MGMLNIEAFHFDVSLAIYYTPKIFTYIDAKHNGLEHVFPFEIWLGIYINFPRVLIHIDPIDSLYAITV